VSNTPENGSGSLTEAAPRRNCYTGWLIPEAVRVRLLGLFPATYPDLVAHHVTHSFGVPCDTPPPSETTGVVVGMADNGKGVQALVVQIGGTTLRTDGSTYHCTWSLDRAAGAKPVDSNRVIRDHGFMPVSPTVSIKLIPKLFQA
jgi:hypothetical protein